ncbi:hypothetical protein [Marinobacter nauticus]|uniref:Uncharacterized protein n=1 Tax=Marinobacter nauticus TaxID=2743 RepID=A0A1M2UVZ2_MARNT|nr:hypothetical protein [Marinobacter nauticus]OJS99523.1 hypothetical protein BEE62_05155 [Marinobacter nauticus]
MKRFGTSALALLLCLSTSACASPKLSVLDPVEPRTETPGVTISRVAHPVTLPLESLAGATFIGSHGELILYNKHKGLFATVVTSDDWGNPSIQMNEVPSYIFNRDLSAVQTPELRKELEGVIRMTLEPAKEKESSVVTMGKITAYIAFNPMQTMIMLTSPDKPDLFTQLVLDNFSWEEIEHEILKGIGG